MRKWSFNFWIGIPRGSHNAETTRLAQLANIIAAAASPISTDVSACMESLGAGTDDIPSTPLGYFLSAMPTVMVLRKSGLMTPPVEGCVLLFYAPLVWLDQHSPTFHGFFKAEGCLIEIIFGE